jgi:anaerobic glycerol-3-phosphate dehydrogenase
MLLGWPLQGGVSFGERIGRNKSTSLGTGDFFRVGNALDGTDFLLAYAGTGVCICSWVLVVAK